MWNFGSKFVYAPWVKYGFQRADFHKTHSYSTIFVLFLYDIFSRFCKVVNKSASKTHFQSNMAFSAQNLTLLGLGKRKYVVSHAEVMDSTRRNLFTPLRKVWLSPSRTAWNSWCCTNFCKNFYMIFHVMLTLCYFLAKKKILLYNTHAPNTDKFSLLLRCEDIEDGLLNSKGMSIWSCIQ